MKYIVVVIIALLLTTLPITIYAGIPFVSGQAILYNPDDDDFRINPLKCAIEAGYQINPHLEAGFEYAIVRLKSVLYSHFMSSSYQATIKIKIPAKNLIPYGVLGIGINHLTNLRLHASDAEPCLSPERVPKTISPAFKYGLGIEYKINKSMAIFTEASYHYSNTGKGANLDTWGWNYGGGVKKYF